MLAVLPKSNERRHKTKIKIKNAIEADHETVKKSDLIQFKVDEYNIFTEWV